MIIEKIYIIHYKYLENRKKYLDKILNKLSIPYEFIINDKDTDNYKMKDIDKYYKYDSNVFNKRLSISEICVTISHFEVYQKILNDNLENVLIVEDDAIFTDNFLENLKKITDELNNFDMCFISECCNLHITNTDERYVYKSDTSRCTSGYILNRKNLKHIINTLPFQYPIDWHLNTINDKIKLKYFWSEPCIIIQGSESIYKSNLR
jgi:GR25 family glycosyltransferase involved in LPS biosynthesis